MPRYRDSMRPSDELAGDERLEALDLSELELDELEFNEFNRLDLQLLRELLSDDWLCMTLGLLNELDLLEEELIEVFELLDRELALELFPVAGLPT